MGISAGSGSGNAVSDINVTPLVDVMLVLLIVFMIAAPIIEQEKTEQEITDNRDSQQRLIALNLPVKTNAAPTTDADGRTVVVKLATTGSVALGGAAIADCKGGSATNPQGWQPCLELVQTAFADSAKAKEVGVTIDAQVQVPFGLVVGVIHRARIAGIEKVNMMPQVAN